jgi:hypothetical protein
VPLALYGDRSGILVRNDAHWTLEEELAGRQTPPQFGQMLEELAIRFIAATSPQAKGRIERLWATLQDRLATELRLKGLDTLAAATGYLPQFIVRHNRRWACDPREACAAFRTAPRDLDRILACRYARVVARDNTVSIPGRWVQIPPGPHRRSWHRAHVEVRELLDGRLRVLHPTHGRIAEQPSPAGPFILESRGAPRARRARAQNRRAASRPSPDRTSPRPATRPRPRPRSTATALWRPAIDHPWKRWNGPQPRPPRARAGGQNH